MSITSLTFFVFLFAALIIYYIVPKRWQWCVLLMASVLFYLSFGVGSAIYVFITATTIYFATRMMQYVSDRQRIFLKANRESLSKEEKVNCKKRTKSIRKSIMISILLLNVGLLCFFKYFHFALEQVNTVVGWFGFAQIGDTFNIIAPLGISFYTFQSIGYLVDVYWERFEPEKNYFKVLLFVSFFPQITQGPISDFSELSTELYSEHNFKYTNYSHGFQRMIWGYAKKMIIANCLSVYVGHIFDNYMTYSGITSFIGMFCYSVQIYADFSGYMDIMCGYCQMLGIKLAENFERPYFSKSVAEYWRRWHITLGVWFKKYIYYPIGMSKWSRKLASESRERFGKHFADVMPATIALIVTWLATGLWHGASYAYAAWGLINGLFIILSLWLDPVYAKCRSVLKVEAHPKAWRVFQVVRTFILVTFIKVLPEVGTLSDGFGLIRHALTNHTPVINFWEVISFNGISANLNLLFFAFALAGTVCMLCLSLIQRKEPVRRAFNRLPYVIRITAISALTMLVITIGVLITFRSGNGGFLYAQF